MNEYKTTVAGKYCFGVGLTVFLSTWSAALGGIKKTAEFKNTQDGMEHAVRVWGMPSLNVNSPQAGIGSLLSKSKAPEGVEPNESFAANTAGTAEGLRDIFVPAAGTVGRQVQNYIGVRWSQTKGAISADSRSRWIQAVSATQAAVGKMADHLNFRNPNGIAGRLAGFFSGQRHAAGIPSIPVNDNNIPAWSGLQKVAGIRERLYRKTEEVPDPITHHREAKTTGRLFRLAARVAPLLVFPAKAYAQVGVSPVEVGSNDLFVLWSMAILIVGAGFMADNGVSWVSTSPSFFNRRVKQWMIRIVAFGLILCGALGIAQNLAVPDLSAFDDLPATSEAAMWSP